MIEFVSTVFHALLGLLHLGLMLLAVLIGAGILVLIARHLTKGRKEQVCKRGLLQFHQTTQFERQQALKSRLAEESATCADSEGQAGAQETTPRTAWDSGKPTMVLHFDGDVLASDRQSFAKLVDEVVANRERISGAIVVVSSPGGGVAHYGQMFAEMERIRNAGVDLTVCVDTYAASGGYLMSVPAHKIVAAPFAIVGSIGVVTEFINAHQFLKNLGFEPVTMTAGKYKRTVTPLSEITEEGKTHYQQQLEAIHRLFIKAVTTYRKVDVEKVCNGDHWTAQESVEQGLGLVDELATSQDYLFKLGQDKDLIFLSEKKSPFERGIFRFLVRLVDHFVRRMLSFLTDGVRA